ncbi:mannitol dehydrogenase family protein [uncultured Sphaerochaeta sp.]|uniref:mannitol dehydrogenase family protein n=1 Tax=uncultured Sphaerochaeta sp. TaxID=886478 RepID=UPI002A0A59D9|nr:mannitol dehydrogenase family protein [uncultured Sphaerochaeta sp.]
MTVRLRNATLHSLDSRIKIPSYDRNALSPKLAHIGLGHFHRAHYLSYLEQLLDQGLYDGGVYEIDIIPSDEKFIKDLQSQDYLYSLQTISTDKKQEIEIRGGILNYANASKDPQTVLDVLASPDIKVISLTITEKGYCYDDVHHNLNFEHPLIKEDLISELWPRTAIGFIAKALNQRFEKGKQKVALLSCDNIPANGHVLKVCLLQFIEKKYPKILEWVKQDIFFPCTMVDRITPGTTEETRKNLHNSFHLDDACPVHSEDFIQWVIEDCPTPEIKMFSQVGASLVLSVEPYELMKIRLLNGSHSALSYPAYLMGITKVDQAIDNPLIHSFIRNYYMEQITKSLEPVPGIDLDEYKDVLVHRFANEYIGDRILRLASDGSKKIANAIIKPLFELKKNDSLVLVLAFWARFLEGLDEHGTPIPIDDPQKLILCEVQDDDKRFLAFIGIQDVRILSLFSFYRKAIREMGTEKVLQHYISGELREMAENPKRKDEKK